MKNPFEKKAFLALADGTILRAHAFGAPVDGPGEVIFNTGMTGYQEILTDPSYKGQIVTLTYPEIGNTGFNPEDFESLRIQANGLIVHHYNEPSNWRATQSLCAALREAGVPALQGIDTRALTTKLRNEGSQKGYICASGKLSPEEGVRLAREWEGLDGQDYASRVSTDAAYVWGRDRQGGGFLAPDAAAGLPPADLKIVAYDFGIKYNILRHLRAVGMDVTVVPAKMSAAEVLKMRPDGVFLSNGPADPAAVTYAVDNIRALLGKVPLMGICLGHQLLGTAMGGKTCRLKFGHHGCNHPVMDLATRTVAITSQNHNFMVDPATLDSAVAEITHINLNDNTVEGLRHRREPAFSVQYHPEAAPGPHDAAPIFKQFRTLIGR